MTLRWRIAQFFEIRWWQRYLRNRSPEEYLDWKRGYWLDFLAKIEIEPVYGIKVLDAGCGPAGIFIALHSCEVDALDPLLNHYAQNLSHFNPSHYPWVHFHPQPLESFRTNARYDLVFCLNAINHVDNLSQCLDHLAALTAPGGTVVLSIDAHRYGFLKRIFRWFPGDILHPHQYDLAEYTKMLTDRGYILHPAIRMKTGGIFNYEVLVGSCVR
jgi:2-polyprenyl-6-hydroxyphenyl methylase/3-demethylubiquinone-9 3-methyltransferase